MRYLKARNAYARALAAMRPYSTTTIIDLLRVVEGLMDIAQAGAIDPRTILGRGIRDASPKDKKNVATSRCSTCRFDKKGRHCPIRGRLHTMDASKKMWALNRNNFGCILWEPFSKPRHQAGSVLDKLDHSRRNEILQLRDERLAAVKQAVKNAFLIAPGELWISEDGAERLKTALDKIERGGRLMPNENFGRNS